MKEVIVSKWYLPAKTWDGPKAKPYLSRWLMDEETAKRYGGLWPEPSSSRMRLMAETPEEERELLLAGDTSALGGPAPGSPSDLKGQR